MTQGSGSASPSWQSSRRGMASDSLGGQDARLRRAVLALTSEGQGQARVGRLGRSRRRCRPPPPPAPAGPNFVQTMQDRQRDNPEFSFLSGGPGAAYYRWALYCQLHGLPPEQALPGQAVAAAEPDTSAALAGLPAEVSSGWKQVLQLLTGSRDSIRNSQQWFMACAPYAAGMVEIMMQVSARARAGWRLCCLAGCARSTGARRAALAPPCPSPPAARAGAQRLPKAAARHLPRQRHLVQGAHAARRRRDAAARGRGRDRSCRPHRLRVPAAHGAHAGARVRRGGQDCRGVAGGRAPRASAKGVVSRFELY